MKRKSLTMILCLLTCLSLVGVGFAAWVISSGDTETVTGNITVDTVSDRRFTFETATISDEIHFGMDDSSAITGAWLTNDYANSENLTVSFEIKLNFATALDAATKEKWDAAVVVTATYSAPDNDNYDNAVSAGAIIAPSSDLTVEFIAEKSTTTQATYKVTIAFAWGEAFDTNRTDYYTTSAPSISDDGNTSDNLNPYAFYNAKTGDVFDRPVAQWGDDAYYYLNLIELMSTLTYNVTVTAAPVTANI